MSEIVVVMIAGRGSYKIYFETENEMDEYINAARQNYPYFRILEVK